MDYETLCFSVIHDKTTVNKCYAPADTQQIVLSAKVTSLHNHKVLRKF